MHVHVGSETNPNEGCYGGSVLRSVKCHGGRTTWGTIGNQCSEHGNYTAIYCASCGGMLTMFCGGCGGGDYYEDCDRTISYYGLVCGLTEGKYYSYEDLHSSCSHCTDATIRTKYTYINKAGVCPLCKADVIVDRASVEWRHPGIRMSSTYITKVQAHDGCPFNFELSDEINWDKIFCASHCNVSRGSTYFYTDQDNSDTGDKTIYEKVVYSIIPRK